MYMIHTTFRGRKIFVTDEQFASIVDAANYLGELREYKYFYVEMDEENDACDIMTEYEVYSIERKAG